MRTRPRLLLIAVAALALTLLAAAPGCSSDSSDDGSSEDGSAPDDEATATSAGGTADPAAPIVLNGQGNNLDAYSPTDDGFAHQRVVTNATDDPEGGLDINAQLCVFEHDGRRMLIAGEDTGQPDPPPGWGIFELSGNALGDLEVTEVAKLTPTFQPDSADNPENYGCGVLDDGRILTTDVGQQVTGDNGQLIVWFPPFEGFAEGDIAYCKVDVTLPTAQSILVTGPDTVLVAASRGGIFEYTGLPTSATPEGGCDSTDATDRPLATGVERRTVVAPGSDGMVSPAGLAPAPGGGFYASSVFTGVINEYDAGGTFVRTILQPPAGEQLGAEPFSTGTPLGIVVDDEGGLWYADIGLVISPDGVGPGDGTGTVRRIEIVDGTPSAPQVVADGLDYPDGMGVLG